MIDNFTDLYLNPSARLLFGALLVGLILIIGPALHNKFKAPNELGFWESFWYSKSDNFKQEDSRIYIPKLGNIAPLINCFKNSSRGEQIYDNLAKVIEKGYEILNASHFDENSFKSWLNYSKKVLSENYGVVYIDDPMQLPDLSQQEKLQEYLEWLVELSKEYRV